jgi:hypothetical protein
MVRVHFVLAVRDKKQDGKVGNASSQELDEIEGGFIGPVDIFKHYNGGYWTLLELLKQSGEQGSPLSVASQKLRETPTNLSGKIVEGSERTRGKERFARSPEPCGCAALLADKLLDQCGFADASLSADQHRASLAGRGQVQER